MKRIIEYGALAWLSASSIVLIGLQIKPLGLVMALAGFIVLMLSGNAEFRRHIGLIYAAVLLLGSIQIGTTTEFPLGLVMGITLLTVAAGPYLLLRYKYNDNTIKFPFRSKTPWTRRDVIYIFVIIIGAYLILPSVLRSDESYLNWVVEPGLWHWVESYVGLNFVGFWDEIFFISTVFVLLKKHFPLWAANLGQAILFTSFLYTLGFGGWAPLVIFPFALSQGYMFHKLHSLTYVLIIHLSIDLILHLTIIQLHYPEWFTFFIT